MQQTDGHRFAAFCTRGRQRGLQGMNGGGVERHEHAAVVRHALCRFDDASEQWRRPAQFAVKQLWAVLLAYHRQVREAGCHHQCHLGAGVFEQGVGGYGGTKPNFGDRITGKAVALEQALDAFAGRILVVFRVHRQQFVHVPLAGRRDGDDIGEGAATVDPEPPALAVGCGIGEGLGRRDFCRSGVGVGDHDAAQFNVSPPHVRSKLPSMEALQLIYAAIAAIPRGEVATYGGIAARAGMPGGARRVARALAEAPRSLRLPWHRVVAAGGRIALPMGSEAHAEQVRRLEREGHVVRNNRVTLPVLQAEGGLDALLWAPGRSKR